jgi:hypothetical protein
MWSPFVGAYIPPAELQIHSFDELEESKQLFLNTIRTMQTWNQEIDDSDESEWSDQQEPRGYKTLLRETVQSETVRHFFEVSPDYINSVQQREQFVLLFALNLLLYTHTEKIAPAPHGSCTALNRNRRQRLLWTP